MRACASPSCERDDLAAWTSSASSKLIHGGLRYLRMGDVKLVREAHAERRALARVVAPHLVRPLRFVMPLRADGPYGPVVIGAGMVAVRRALRVPRRADPGRRADARARARPGV